MAHVAGVQDERRPVWQRADAVDGFLKRAGDVHIGDVLEADMAIADLNEAEVTRRSVAAWRQGAGRQDAGAQRPHDAGTGPGHAFEESAAVDVVGVVVFVEDCVTRPVERSGAWVAHWTITLAVMNGWMAQK